MYFFKKTYQDFIRRLTILEDRSEKIIFRYKKIEMYEFKYLSEGLVSDAWQSWCLFVRNIINYSCNESITRNGIVVPKRVYDNTWQRIGYEAAQAAKNSNIKPNNKNNYIRQEPTWGDIAKIIDIITALNPNNKSQLLSAFGLPVYGPKHMQTIRNACQHKNQDTINAVKILYSHYSISNNININFSPAFIIREINSSNNSFIFHSWLDDFRIIANNSTN